MPQVQNDDRSIIRQLVDNAPWRVLNFPHRGMIYLRNHPSSQGEDFQQASLLQNRPTGPFGGTTVILRDMAHQGGQISNGVVRPDYFSSHWGSSFSTSACDFQWPVLTLSLLFSNAASSASLSAASCIVAPSGSVSIAACACSFVLLMQKRKRQPGVHVKAQDVQAPTPENGVRLQIARPCKHGYRRTKHSKTPPAHQGVGGVKADSGKVRI